MNDKPDGKCKLSWPESTGNSAFTRTGIWNKGLLIQWLHQEEEPVSATISSDTSSLRSAGSAGSHTKRNLQITLKIHNSLKSLDSMEKRLDKDMRDL